MQLKRWILCVALLSGMVRAEDRQDPAGSYDPEIDSLLHRAVVLVSLRETDVSALVPEYVLPCIEPLEWEQALREADRRFAHQPIKRALYLWSQLPADADSGLLYALGLPETGFSSSTGSGRSMTLVLDPGSAPGRRPAKDARATLSFWISHGDPSEVGRWSLLNVNGIVVEEFPFKLLSFDSAGKLAGFSACRDLPGGIRLEIGGNTTGAGNTDFYYAYVNVDGKHRESIEFSPGLIMRRRRVRDAALGLDYCDVYEEGELVRRNHYGTILDEHGTQTVIVEREIFNTPQD